MIKHFFLVPVVSAIVLFGSVHAQEPAPLIVHFPFGSYRLPAAAKDSIDVFFRVGGRAGDTVLLSGYTDSIGTSGYNEGLSIRRAVAVRDYLVARGLSPAGRIKTAGYGKLGPVASNGTDSERAANRRVEIFFRSAPAGGASGPLQRDSVTAVVRESTSAQRDTAVTPASKEDAVIPAEKGTTVVPVQKEAPVSPAGVEVAAPPTPPKQSIYDAVMDSSVAVGSTIPLRDVNFYPGRHFPLPVCNRILDELARAMKANRRLRIHIEGHICCLPEGIDGADLGTGQPNLSVQRAKYVYDYLVMRGIARRRMSYDGYGASGKLYPLEENEEQRAENRRVEIRIMAK